MLLDHRKNTWLLLIVLSLYSLAACTGSNLGLQPTTSTSGTSTGAITTPLTGVTQTPATLSGGDLINHQLLDTVPAQIQSTLESSQKIRGYLYFPTEKLLVIFMGERSTGGYSIQLQTIRRSGDTLLVETMEKSPKPGDFVTQGFTYPRLIIQLEDAFTAFSIQDRTGLPYAKIEGVQY